MQYINLNYDSDMDYLRDALKYLLRNSLLHATLINGNTIEFYDESALECYTYQIPQPYSEGADPTGDLNVKEYLAFQKKVTDELNKCFGDAHGNISDDHAIIATEFESLEVHFNDSTLTLIYHNIGPQ